MGLERKSVHSVGKVLRLVSVSDTSSHFMLDGDEIRADIKYRLFIAKGVFCAGCGVAGAYFAKERWPGVECWHLNLYGLLPDGNEVLMTKDHIRPRSLSGPGTLSNLQVMCKLCNEEKGDDWDESWEGVPGC